MSEQHKSGLRNLQDLEQPVEELTPEQAEAAKGGIIIIGGNLWSNQYAISTTPKFGSLGALNPQPLPP